jgi:hypothetical protein
MTARDIWQAVALFLIVVGFLVGTAYIDARERARNTAVICTSARANIEQLTALREIADQLGVPTQFKVSEVPAECLEP